MRERFRYLTPLQVKYISELDFEGLVQAIENGENLWTGARPTTVANANRVGLSTVKGNIVIGADASKSLLDHTNAKQYLSLEPFDLDAVRWRENVSIIDIDVWQVHAWQTYGICPILAAYMNGDETYDHTNPYLIGLGHDTTIHLPS